MSIVFIHGVAVRREGDPGWEQVSHQTSGVQWEAISARLREFIAPQLDARQPENVNISEIYWGDLGANYGLGGRSLGSWSPPPAQPDLSHQSSEETGEQLEEYFRLRTLARDWPRVMEAVWSVARDENLREIMLTLPPNRQQSFLTAAVESRLPQLHLRELLEEPRPPALFLTQRRKSLRRTLVTVRRPIEDFVPLFLGDVLAYTTGRGIPGQPGPIMHRVLDGLYAAWLAAPQEPLVVLSHSMGGQLIYDALTAFMGADPRFKEKGIKVDFWCACGSQVGLFRELGQFIEQQSLPTSALLDSPYAGYFWNVWSYSDFLSYRAEGVIAGAHDTAFPFLGNVRSDHLAYLSDIDFYRALATKVALHTTSPQRSGQPRT